VNINGIGFGVCRTAAFRKVLKLLGGSLSTQKNRCRLT